MSDPSHPPIAGRRILDDETFQRTVEAESAWYRSYALNLQRFDREHPDHPLGATVCEDETGAFGIRTRAASDEIVVNLSRDLQKIGPDPDAVRAWHDRLLAATDGAGAVFFAMVPSLVPRSAYDALRSAGCYHSGAWHQLWAPVDELAPIGELPAGVAVRPLEPGDEEAFVEAYVAGEEFGTVAERTEFAKAEFTIDRAPGGGWTVLTATVDGEPAGFGYFHHATGPNVGCLSGGWTRPSMQGRGCQSALIRARGELAREAGCDMVISQCGVTGTSNRNLQRAGLRAAYTIAIWRTA